MSTSAQIPPPPPGYTVDSTPPPPPGYTLDSAQPQTEFAPPPGTPGLDTAAKPNVQMRSASGPERFATSLAAGTGDLLQTAAAVRGQGSPDSYNPAPGQTPEQAADESARAMLAQHQAPLQELEGAVRGMVQPVKDIASEAKYDKADALGDAIPLAATLVGGEREAVRSTRAPRAEFAEHQITKLIKPSAADLKYGAEPAASLPREGIVGNSLESLGEQVNARAHKVGQAIDAVLASPENRAKVVDVSAAVNGPIDAAEANATRAGDKALFAKLQALREQVNHTWRVVEDENGNRQLAPQAPRQMQMSPEAAVQLKRDIADMTRWTGDPMDPAINGVRAQIFAKIKDAVNAAVPEVAGLNNRYADLVHAAKAIERRAPVADRNAAFSLGDMGAAGLGVAVGHSTPAAAALLAAHKVARSPGVVSRVARAMMPSELMYEDPDAIIARAQQGGPPEKPSAPQSSAPPAPDILNHSGESSGVLAGNKGVRVKGKLPGRIEPSKPYSATNLEPEDVAAPNDRVLAHNEGVRTTVKGQLPPGPPEPKQLGPTKPHEIPPSSLDRRGGPRNGHVFTESERAEFRRRMDSVEKPFGHESPFDRDKSHSRVINTKAARDADNAAMDVLSGRAKSHVAKGMH